MTIHTRKSSVEFVDVLFLTNIKYCIHHILFITNKKNYMNSIQANGKFWDKSSISQRVNVVHFLASALLHPSQINDFLSM